MLRHFHRGSNGVRRIYHVPVRLKHAANQINVDGESSTSNTTARVDLRAGANAGATSLGSFALAGRLWSGRKTST